MTVDRIHLEPSETLEVRDQVPIGEEALAALLGPCGDCEQDAYPGYVPGYAGRVRPRLH